MVKIMVIVCYFILGILISFQSKRILESERTIQELKFKYKELKVDKELLEQEKYILSVKLDNYNIDIHENNKIIKEKDFNIIKKAIKKAMVSSHPDKGGSSEDFIMFKKLYDKYSK